MTMLITKRPCRIGSSINTRTEKHGDEDVPACDIPLEAIMIDANELNILLGDTGAHKALFRKGKNGSETIQEPAFRQLKSFVLKDKFEDANVLLTVGINGTEVELADVKLAKVTLAPQVGGLTELSLQVQATPDVEDIAEILQYLNGEEDVAIEFGKRAEKAASKQKDLPINTFGDGEQPEAPATH
jgi:hypothetical protein